MIIIVFMVFLITQVGCSCALDYPEAQVTVKVVDKNGIPIEGAKAGVTFEMPKGTSQGLNNETIGKLIRVNSPLSIF